MSIGVYVGPSYGHTAYQVSTFDPQAHREVFVKYIISAKYIIGADMLLSIEEHPTHQEYARSLCPQYQLESRITIVNDLIEYYNRRRATLQEELQKKNIHCHPYL